MWPCCMRCALEARVGLEADGIRVVGVVELSGDIPWGYNLLLGGEPMTMAATVARDVVYGHETIASAGSISALGTSSSYFLRFLGFFPSGVLFTVRVSETSVG